MNSLAGTKKKKNIHINKNIRGKTSFNCAPFKSEYNQCSSMKPRVEISMMFPSLSFLDYSQITQKKTCISIYSEVSDLILYVGV